MMMRHMNTRSILWSGQRDAKEHTSNAAGWRTIMLFRPIYCWSTTTTIFMIPPFSKRRICHFVCLYNTCKSNHCACAWWCTSIDASFFYRRIHTLYTTTRSHFLFLYVIHAAIEEMARLLIRWKYEMNDHAIKLLLWKHIKISWKRRGWVFHMRTPVG